MQVNKENLKERFLKDVSNHSINIVRDDGVYRHLIFSNNGSSIYRFDIVTWPGYLAYAGDMGSFVFTRTEDMFSFFRNSRKEINLSYWSEKVVAQNKHDGVEEFSIEEFRENVLRRVRSWLSLDDGQDIPSDMLNEIQPLLDAEDMIDAVENIRDFRSDKIDFNDWWEFDNNVYTRSFIWCCYAIVWGIDLYDATKENEK